MTNNGTKKDLGNLIIIDDSEVDRFLTKKILEVKALTGHIFDFSLATEALRFIEKVLAEGKIDLFPSTIIVDLNMPEMDGFEFLEHLLDDYYTDLGDPTIIMLTSSTSQDDRKRARDLSEKIIFMSKPFDLSLLSDRF
jgi:CheY-like chemotaxis protein